jgi:hypothetical protein
MDMTLLRLHPLAARVPQSADWRIEVGMAPESVRELGQVWGWR